MLSLILKAATIGLSAGVTPGPYQAILLSYAIQGGWKKALPAAFAPLVSDGPVILLVLLVLNKVPDSFLRFMQIGGALFLLYLAWDSYRAFRNYREVETQTDIKGFQTLLKATGMNLLSPGPWLFWSLINGPNLLEVWAVSPWWGVGYLASFYGVFILTNLVLIGLFATLRKTGEKVRKTLLLVSAIALAGFAIYQFLQGINIL